MNDYFNWIDSPDDVEFAENLRAHVISGSPSWTPLLSEDRVERVNSALVVAKRDLETAIADMNMERSEFQAKCYRRGHYGRADWLDYEASFKHRRAEIVRVKNAFDAALGIVKPALKAYRNAESERQSREYIAARGPSGDVQQFAKLAEHLARAIDEHKQAIDWSGNQATNSDRALWTALARLKVPTRGGDISVREWLARLDAPVRG